MKISVITPSLNSADYIEKAICSVLDQDYKNYEHIIVDGGSTDRTIDLLERYGHLKWVSEKDRGQSHAMNKGFNMASGQIINYLMADDYFLCNAFNAVVPYFEAGCELVMGDIVVQKEDGYFINTPRTTLAGMLRHWEMNAFAYNPLGYFYTRKVREAVPFNEQNHAMMDLEFLLGAASMFEFRHVNALLGVYRCFHDTKTVHDQLRADYWSLENFTLIDKYLATMPVEYIETFRRDRIKGYEDQRRWQNRRT